MNKKLILLVTIFTSKSLVSCGEVDGLDHKHKTINPELELDTFTSKSSAELENNWLSHQSSLLNTGLLLEIAQAKSFPTNSIANLNTIENTGYAKLETFDNNDKNTSIKKHQINSGEYIWPSDSPLNITQRTTEDRINNEEELWYFLESFELKL